jgi:hypothetical protein
MVRAAAVVCAVAVCLLAVATAPAAGPLFPTPLHITRQVHDSISGTTAVLDEYAYGNQLVSIRGMRTSIADYEKSRLTEIDRAEGTYSVTRFDALAKATQVPAGGPARALSSSSSPRTIQSLGVRTTKTNRSAEFFQAEVETQPGKETIEIGVDRSIRISKDALEVLLGSAYPGVRTAEHEAALQAAGPQGRAVAAQSTASSPAAESYALPVEETVRYDFGGQQAEFRTAVVRVGGEAVPADLIAIPAGARLVTSRIIAATQEVDRIQHPPIPAKEH